MDSFHQPGGLGSHQPRPLACNIDPVLLVQPTHSGAAAAKGLIDAKDPQALCRRTKNRECNLEEAERSTASAILVSAVSARAQKRRKTSSLDEHDDGDDNIGSSSFLPQPQVSKRIVLRRTPRWARVRYTRKAC
jgi:hypothetical protein